MSKGELARCGNRRFGIRAGYSGSKHEQDLDSKAHYQHQQKELNANSTDEGSFKASLTSILLLRLALSERAPDPPHARHDSIRSSCQALAGVVFFYCLCSAGMLLVNKLAIVHLPLPALLTLLQFSVGAIGVQVPSLEMNQ